MESLIGFEVADPTDIGLTIEKIVQALAMLLAVSGNCSKTKYTTFNIKV